MKDLSLDPKNPKEEKKGKEMPVCVFDGDCKRSNCMYRHEK
jgi:hypothetical protein